MLVQRLFPFVKHGKFKLRFKFIQSNSTFTQAIKVFLINFRGNIKLNEKSIRLSKGNYPQVVFFENSSPKEIELDLEIQQGWISICNASDPSGYYLDTETGLYYLQSRKKVSGMFLISAVVSQRRCLM